MKKTVVTTTVNLYSLNMRQQKQAFIPMRHNHHCLRARVRRLSAVVVHFLTSFIPCTLDWIPTAALNGTNQASTWSIVPSTGQTVNSQSVTSLVPWTTASSSHGNFYSIDAALSMPSLPTLGTRSATLLPISGDRRYVHPAYWTVQETVHWLRSKGFEETVCQRFVEEEIAGDALLHLDVSKLKTEVGIVAYGKRVRIDSAISECRRLARAMSSSVIQPMRSGSSSRSDLPSQQSTALGRAPIHSASTGDLMSPKTPPDLGCLRKAPSIPGHSISNARDLDEQSTADKSDATTTGLRLLVSSWLSSGSSQGKTAVSVHFWQDM